MKQPWGLDEGERLKAPAYLRVHPFYGRKFYTASIGYMSQLGRYLRDQEELAPYLQGRDAYEEYLSHLLTEVGGYFLTSKEVEQDGGTISLYRLKASSILWVKGNGDEVEADPVRYRSFRGTQTPRVNAFFRDVYRAPLQGTKPLSAAEHTGQLGNDDRKERERQFREGSLSTLFCSPTMELGIDIADLSVVHLRNVPPSPANYAQRSGRAGRSGQAALVVTYCANQSPHDRHYFRHARDMVAGVVAPPRIDLANQELLRTHLHALYMAEVGLSTLDESISEMVDLSLPHELPLRTEIREKLRLSDEALRRVTSRFREVVADVEGQITASWYTDDWVADAVRGVPETFDRALDRWRHLYRVAIRQLDEAQRHLDDPTYDATHDERKAARREEMQARRQRDLLKNEATGSRHRSEFYPYRYLAAEGFLPGYNFTRLPLRAFLPVGDEGEYVARPRDIALREFGPYNQIYHNGSKYEVSRQQVLDIEGRLEKAKVSRPLWILSEKRTIRSRTLPVHRHIASGRSGARRAGTPAGNGRGARASAVQHNLRRGGADA